MNLNTLLLPIFWLLNGLLVCGYVLAAFWATLLLLPSLAWLSSQGPEEHRPRALAIAGLALLVSLIAPLPVPLLLLVMALAASLALALERFNPAGLHWRMLGGLGLYALIGAGISAFQLYSQRLAVDNPLVSQGQVYISLMAGIGLYGVPLGFLALLAQGLLIHPPLPGRGQPEGLIHALRARNEE